MCDIKEKIAAGTGNFSKREMKVAEYIVENYQQILYMSGSELAKAAGVSDATVVRFAKTLGYSGFSQFRNDMKNEARRKRSPYSFLKKMPEISKSGYERFLSALSEDMALFGDEIDADKIDYVAECLLKAETVYLVGIGSDGVMVKYMSDYLTTMGKKCIAIYDEGISLRQKILTASSKDFILLASFPTVQPDEYWTASFAMENGIGAALITDSELTAAALGMPCFFNAKVPMESFFNSSVFVMILCDMILMKMYDLDESGIAAALKRYDEVTGNA